MSFIKKKVELPDQGVIDRVARQLALESFLNPQHYDPETNQRRNVLSGDWMPEEPDFMKYVTLYKNALKDSLGQTLDIPEQMNTYPYYNFVDDSKRLEGVKTVTQFIVRDFRDKSQEEMSEKDMQLQSVLMMRQYLRMLRRLMNLTYFHSNKDDEVATFINKTIRCKFPLSPASLDRLANSMYFSGYNFHYLY